MAASSPDGPKDFSGEQQPAHPGGAAVRMKQNGKVDFRLFDADRIVYHYVDEPEEIRTSRSRRHDRLISLFLKPLAQFAFGSFCVLLGVLLTRRIEPQPAASAGPIEYVPAGLAEEVEAARGALERYFSAGSINEKLKQILPGVSADQMKAYFGGGGSDLALSRENILYSEKHSDRARHWYSFTLIPPGTLREIRTFVKMDGGRPLLHWPAYIQEKDGFASRMVSSSRPGVHDLRIGACRAASLEGKSRVALIGMDGTTLGYFELRIPNAGEILDVLDYRKPVSATVQFTTLPDGSKYISRWKAWGLDLPKPKPAAPENMDREVSFTGN